MNEIIPRPDPLGLPVPPELLLALKLGGFVLHMIFMQLWLAGLPAALALLYCRPRVADRLFRAMPFFLAFGINAGIVPLLFIQTLYAQFFYPATILQAWFWFLVIPLLMIAYYAVYLAAFDRFRTTAAIVAALLLSWIGLSFSAVMTLFSSPEKWPEIFLATAQAGSVHGLFLHLPAEAFLRWLLMAGMACGTVAAYLALDAEWFARDPDYGSETRAVVAFLYAAGLLLYAAGAGPYAPMVESHLPALWRVSVGAALPAAALLALLYWRSPGRGAAVALGAAQLFVVVANALARQAAQTLELEQWLKLERLPVRGEWGSFILFAATLAIALGVVTWLAWIALRARKPSPAAAPRSA